LDGEIAPMGSYAYQYKIREVAFDSSVVESFAVYPPSISERLAICEEALIKALCKLVEGNILTPHQREVVKMRLEGETVASIAKKKNVSQSNIIKTLIGNDVHYSEGYFRQGTVKSVNNNKRYGGAYKKLRKYCEKSWHMRQLLDLFKRVQKADGKAMENGFSAPECDCRIGTVFFVTPQYLHIILDEDKAVLTNVTIRGNWKWKPLDKTIVYLTDSGSFVEEFEEDRNIDDFR
jgi:hypothetical protein